MGFIVDRINNDLIKANRLWPVVLPYLS